MQIEMKILNKEFYERIEHRAGEIPRGYYSLPSYATPGSAAIDLICTKDTTLYPGECKLIPTGLAIWIGSASAAPKNREYLVYNDIGNMTCNVAGIILPRSGRGHNEGLILGNTIGLLDEDHQGEIMVSAWNRSTVKQKAGFPDIMSVFEKEDDPITIKAGERFAQLAFLPIIKAQFQVVEEFSNNTERATGGFGSTGY